MLEYGSVADNKLKKLREKQAILGSYWGGTEDHTITFFSGHHNINAMKIGDKMVIGHMNYVDDLYENSYIYLLKADDDHYQFIYKDQPLAGYIRNIEIFPDLATEYEPILN